MNWLDTVAILAIIAIASLEAWRKFGKALFDVVGGLLAIHVAHAAQPGLAALVSFSADPDTNQAASFATVFVVLAALTVIASKYLYNVTLLALPDAFEGFGGAVLGIVSGVVVAHAIVWMVFTSAGGDVRSNPYKGTLAVNELVQWDTYHQALDSLKHLGE